MRKLKKTAGMMLILTLVLFLLTGFSSKETKKFHYIYEGHNDSWSARFTVDGKIQFWTEKGKLHGGGSSDGKFTVIYKKSAPPISSSKQLIISFASNNGGIRTVINKPSSSTYVYRLSSGPIQDPDEVIYVKITFRGKTESINLKKVQR